MWQCGNLPVMARDDPFIRWQQFADGEWHWLEAGEHYHRDWKLVRKAAQMWASREGMVCNVEQFNDGAKIQVLFRPRETVSR